MPSAPPLVFTRGEFRGQTVHYRTGHLIIKVYTHGDDSREVPSVITEVLNDYLDRSGFTIVAKLVGRWAYLRLDDGSADILTLVKNVSQDPRVEYAEPDLKMIGSTTEPNPGDPLLYEGSEFQQWGIDYINLFEVWETQTGDESVLIGLIDSGVPLAGDENDSPGLGMPLTSIMDHIDLDGSRFIAGNNYYLFDPPKPWPHDNHDYHHGTNMAGIIAAKENNKNDEGEFIGTAGVNWGSPVYVTVAIDPGNDTTVGYVKLATKEILDYAAENNIPHVVINLCINQEDDIALDSMSDMFNDIVAAGAIICISAGNGTVDESGILVQQPAKLGVETENFFPHVIVVGAVDDKGALYYLSGRGIKDMVFAPGVKVATTDKNNSWEWEDGTSIATAHVSGLAALLWSEDHNLLATEVVKCIKNTCRLPAGTDDEAETEPQYLSLGIVDALAALQAIRGSAELLTPSIVFADVEPGLDHEQEIRIQVTSCLETTFIVTVDTAGHGFGISPGSYSHDSCGEDPFTLVATYSATDGDSVSGKVTVIWEQRPDYRWEIEITAQRAVQRKSIYLVLDKSGSMSSNSGIGAYTRLEVLKYSAGILVDLIDPGHGLGAVSFDSEAQELAPYTVIQPEGPDPARMTLKTAFETLEAGGLTSIAAGILAAGDRLDALPDEDTKAIIVLTDGRETHEPWLEELIAEGIPYPVFAIGMGTAASLQPAALDALAAATDGYAVLTGDLDETTENAVAEFLSQILAEICGPGVPTDPTQRIRPGAVQRFPITLSEADKQVEVILMRSPGAPLTFKVLDPSFRPLDPGMINVMETERLVRFHFPGPAAHRRSGFTGNGIWQVEVSVSREEFSGWVKDLRNRGVDTGRVETHGTPFTFRAHAQSNLKMKCRVSQSGYAPGSTQFLYVKLTDRGRPLPWRSSVTAQVTDPSGRMRTLHLGNRGNGYFETSIEAVLPGVYKWQITAEGSSRAGHSFRREYRLTGAIWNPDSTGTPLPQPVRPMGSPSGWSGPT